MVGGAVPAGGASAPTHPLASRSAYRPMFHVEHFENAYQVRHRCQLPEAPTPSAPATRRAAFYASRSLYPLTRQLKSDHPGIG